MTATLTRLESVSLNSYTGFVPKRVLQHFTDNPQPLDSAWSECIDGVVLYIVLDGFKKTQIQLLNTRFIEPIISTVQSYGGDIIDLDAYGLLILWQWEDKASHVEIRLAAYCALQIMEHLFATTNNQKSEEPLTASVKIGISASDHLFFSTIGGYQNRWQYMLSGQAVKEARESALYAQSGDIIISPSTWDHIKDCSDGTPVNDRGFTRLTSLKKFSSPLNISRKPPPSHSKGLQQFLSAHVPPPIQVELTDAQKQLWCYMDRSELRCMTFLFLYLPEMSVDWNTESKVQKIYALFQRIAIHQLGVDVKSFMDSRGLVFGAIFGCPVYFYEQHSLRALLAALELEQEMNLMHLPFKIGVACAEFFCGVVGIKERKSYAFYSKAARQKLQTIIKEGEMNRITMDLRKDRYHSYPAQQTVYVKHPLLTESGCFPLPLEMRKAAQHAEGNENTTSSPAAEPSERHPQFVLRDKTLSLMLQKLQDLCERKSCGAIFLEGQQGAGKSFLVNEFLRIAHEKDVPVKILHGYCCICEKTSQYFPLRKAFSQLRQAKSASCQHLDAIAGHTSMQNFTTEDTSKTTSESNVTTCEHSSNSNSYDDEHTFDDLSYSYSYNSSVPGSHTTTGMPVSSNTSIPTATAVPSHSSSSGVPLSPQSSTSNPIFNGTHYISPSNVFNLTLTQSGKLKRVESSSQIEDMTDDLLQYQEILDEFLVESHTNNNCHPHPIDNQNKGLILVSMLIRILENESEEQPILCIIENAQWADEGTISFITQCLNRKMKSVLFVVCARTPSKNPSLTEKLLSKQSLGVHIEVDLLTESEIEKLACHVLGVNNLPGVVVTTIQKYSQGILASVIELAHYLKTKSFIEIEEGICIPKSTLKSIKYQSDFVSHHALHAIMNTIDDLKPSLRIILEVAAVTDSFDTTLLSLCAPALHQFDITEQLKELHKQGMIQPNPAYKPQMVSRSSFDIPATPTETVDMYIFSKGCWKEAIYSMIYPSRKQHIHSIAATYYETKDLQSKKSPDIKKLAYHYGNSNLYSAEMHEKAIFYLEKAGEMYMKRNANCQGIYYYAKLVDMHKKFKSQHERLYDEIRVSIWERMLGKAHTELAEYPQAIAHLESSLQLLKHPIPEDSKLAGVAQIFYEAGKQALSFLVPKKNRTEDSTVVVETIRTLYSAAEAYFFTHDFLKFSYCIIRELTLAEGLPETSPEVAIAYVNMAFLAFFWGHQSMSNKYVQHTMTVLNKIQDPGTSAYAFVRIGYFTLIAGDYYKAIDYIAKSDIVKLGNKQIMFIGSAVHGMAYYMLGDYDNSAKVFCQLIDFQKEDGSSFATLVGRGCLAVVYCAQNRIDDAIEILKAADRTSDFDFGSGRLAVDACKAWTHVLKGNWSIAYEMVTSIVKTLCVYRTSFSISRLVAYENTCRILYALIKKANSNSDQSMTGKDCNNKQKKSSNRTYLSALRVLMTDILGSFEQYNSGHPFGKVPWMFHVARLHRVCGEKQKALSVVSTALKYIHNEKVTMPFYQGALSYELSLLLDRADLLTKAESIFKTIGMDLSILDRL